MLLLIEKCIQFDVGPCSHPVRRLPQIQDIIRSQHLLTVFRPSEDSHGYLDVAILQALLKGRGGGGMICTKCSVIDQRKVHITALLHQEHYIGTDTVPTQLLASLMLPLREVNVSNGPSLNTIKEICSDILNFFTQTH